MGNVLTPFQVPLWTATALDTLKKSLGIGARVYRGAEAERSRHNQGEYVNFKRPPTFVAQNEPSSAQDAQAETVSLQLTNWKGVRFALTDKEVALTDKEIMEVTLPEAVYAVADAIDQSVWTTLYQSCPYVLNAASSTVGNIVIDDILAADQMLKDQRIPKTAPRYFGVGTAEWAKLLGQSAFSQSQGAGQVGVNTQLTGELGMRFGAEYFWSQNRPVHTPGALTADVSGTLSGAHAKGATSIVIAAVSTGVTNAVRPGDSIVIATSTSPAPRYAIASAANSDGGGNITVTIDAPGLLEDYGNGVVVTIDTEQTKKSQNILFTPQACALVMADLPDYAKYGGLGMSQKTMFDPQSSLSLRVGVYADPTNSKVFGRVDALWGVRMLQPKWAVRLRSA